MASYNEWTEIARNCHALGADCSKCEIPLLRLETISTISHGCSVHLAVQNLLQGKGQPPESSKPPSVKDGDFLRLLAREKQLKAMLRLDPSGLSTDTIVAIMGEPKHIITELLKRLLFDGIVDKSYSMVPRASGKGVSRVAVWRLRISEKEE